MSVRRARALRQTQTEAEGRLWGLLRSRRLVGFKFRRQHPVGPFIVDFASVRHRVAIEVDGSQHADSAADGGRTWWLERQGWRVLRVWNNEVTADTDRVLEAILAALQE